MTSNRVAAKKLATYVGTLTTKAMEAKEEQTSDEIAQFIHNQMVNDIKTRINTILAVGIELGRVAQDGNRFKVNKAIVRLDRTLDNCRKKRTTARHGVGGTRCHCRMRRAQDKVRIPLFHKHEDRKHLRIGGRK